MDIQKQVEKGVITEEEAATKIERLEKQKARDLYRVEKARFRFEKITNLVGVAVDTARAISKSVAASPLTGGLPWSASAAALGAAQAAAIISKKPPPPPSFAEGGTVIKGKPHSQGGEDIYVGGVYRGNMQGDEGLFVTKKEATQKALSYINEQAGGNSFFSGGHRYLEQGGRVAQGTGMNQEDVINIMNNMPPLVVEATSIMGAVEAEKESNDLGVV